MSLHPLPQILERIQKAAQQAGRDPSSVNLLAVTKGHSALEIEQRVLAFGDFALGEAKGQELRDKKPLLPAQTQWHFIGPLQRNKVKYLEGVSLIHTLENLEVAQELLRFREKWATLPQVLIQVHNGETQKHGVELAQVPEFLQQLQDLGLEVRGLMVMAPRLEEGQNPEPIRHVFRQTASLAAKLDLLELSMGMSDDFEWAILEGATIVRIGGAIFS